MQVLMHPDTGCVFEKCQLTVDGLGGGQEKLQMSSDRRKGQMIEGSVPYLGGLFYSGRCRSVGALCGHDGLHSLKSGLAAK